MKIRTLIIDDEPLAREGIRIRLNEYPEVRIIGECNSGLEAVSMIEELKPDLLFLDIQMPGMNGFEVLQRLNINPIPIIIFITAFDKYALKAFEFHALDYLLKPINDDRFKETVRAVIVEANHRNLETYSAKLKGVLNDYLDIIDEKENSNRTTTSSERIKNFLSRLMIKSKETISVIPISDIDWIDSAGDYVYVHTNTKKHIFRENIKCPRTKTRSAGICPHSSLNNCKF